jgi:peptidoglycan/xylan/chitin deacetylase (PgdA/CDA1 family)
MSKLAKAEKKVYFCLSTDCEAMQPAISDVSLGCRAVNGIVEILEKRGWKGTFFVIPSDLKGCSELYKGLYKTGHEVGLHLHPAAEGYAEFLGVYSGKMQTKILSEGVKIFSQIMGYNPRSFCAGYASTNDYTYNILVELGFTHGICSIPGRILPECAAVWAGAPLFIHYTHPWNRLLEGNLDFVEIPNTLDWESHMWGGKHPQDLRIELVDAKNHFYTIQKSLQRQINEQLPVKVIHAATHNTFEYGDPANFRRQTLEGVITHTENIAKEFDLELVGTTLENIVKTYKSCVKPSDINLALDRRGYLRQEDKAK